jgi:hypothetical protein
MYIVCVWCMYSVCVRVRILPLAIKETSRAVIQVILAREVFFIASLNTNSLSSSLLAPSGRRLLRRPPLAPASALPAGDVTGYAPPGSLAPGEGGGNLGHGLSDFPCRDGHVRWSSPWSMHHHRLNILYRLNPHAKPP